MNTIVMQNLTRMGSTLQWTVQPAATNISYSCTWPLPPGQGNISTDPLLIDGEHLAVGSPCRGAGNAVGGIIQDLDGDNWATPPSIGCDEVVEAGLVGSLEVGLRVVRTNAVLQGLPLGFLADVTGRASRIQWGYGDGVVVTNGSWRSDHAFAQPGIFQVTITAFNLDRPEGVSTNVTVLIYPVLPPEIRYLTKTENGTMLVFHGQDGQLYELQGSTNAALPESWTLLRLISDRGGGTVVSDSPRTNAQYFYRVHTRPW